MGLSFGSGTRCARVLLLTLHVMNIRASVVRLGKHLRPIEWSGRQSSLGGKFKITDLRPTLSTPPLKSVASQTTDREKTRFGFHSPLWSVLIELVNPQSIMVGRCRRR